MFLPLRSGLTMRSTVNDLAPRLREDTELAISLPLKHRVLNDAYQLFAPIVI